jgi:hypothetical protein
MSEENKINKTAKVKNPIRLRANQQLGVCIRSLIFTYACVTSSSRDWAGRVKAAGGGFRVCLKKIT